MGNKNSKAIADSHPKGYIAPPMYARGYKTDRYRTDDRIADIFYPLFFGIIFDNNLKGCKRCCNMTGWVGIMIWRMLHILDLIREEIPLPGRSCRSEWTFPPGNMF